MKLQILYPVQQTIDKITRLVGVIHLEHFINLVLENDLDANPRDAKRSIITTNIMRSLADDEEKGISLFPFKSKGILISISTPVDCIDSTTNDKTYNIPLNQHKTYNLLFNKYKDGILDGGHTALAISLYIIQKILGKYRVKNWNEVIDIFSDQNNQKIIQQKIHLFDSILVPIEIIFPANNDPDTIEYYTNIKSKIAHARNKNAQVSPETLSNQGGIYEPIKKILPNNILSEISWKENDGIGKIKVRDIVTWTAIPFVSQEEMRPKLPKITILDLYHSKKATLNTFEQFIIDNGRLLDNNTYTVEIKEIQTGLSLLPTILKCSDYIQKEFAPYHNNVDGAAPITKEIKSRKTLFTTYEYDYNIPVAQFFPIVCGLHTLISYKQNTFSWTIDPMNFLEEYLPHIIEIYTKEILIAYKYNATTYTKQDKTYDTVQKAFKVYL